MIQNTPIEKYQVKERDIYVKREDLACLPPGPPFAKVRGLLPVLEELKADGIKTIGYMDTSISMAGWGISYFCKQLGMKAVLYYPQYKDGFKHNQELHLSKWKEFGAEILPIEKPNRMQINFYRARKHLEAKYSKTKMLPLGLTFQETVEKVSKQVIISDRDLLKGTIVSCVGSGAMLAGVLKGCHQVGDRPDCYGILVSDKNDQTMRKKILKMSGLSDNYSLFNGLDLSLSVVNAGYEYTEKEEIDCPFPCNPYYDRKAWKWLVERINSLKEPILFWNIGT